MPITVSVRSAIPASVRAAMHWGYDRLHYSRHSDIAAIGDPEASPWTLRTSLIPPRPFVISGGAGKDISFERELVERFDATVLLFDPSPIGVETMKRSHHPNIRCYELGLAARPGVVQFAPPLQAEEGSFRLPDSGSAIEFRCTSIPEVARQEGRSSIDILKLDIEGFEYRRARRHACE